MVARLSAERIFSLVDFKSFNGTFIAIPGFRFSRSESMKPIRSWCLPLRLCGTSTIEVVSNFAILLGVVAIARLPWPLQARGKTDSIYHSGILDAIIKVSLKYIYSMSRIDVKSCYLQRRTAI